MFNNIKHTYQRVIKFLLHDIWILDMTELSIMRARLIRYLRVFLITIKNFGKDLISLRVAGLTYYSALSLVPMIAIMFIITEGFGLNDKLTSLIYTYFEGSELFIDQLIKFANNIVKASQNGIFGIISCLVLLWSVIWLMISIETSFNEIWKVTKPRTLGKRFLYYFILILSSPLIVIIFMSLTLTYNNALSAIGIEIDKFIPISPIFYWLSFYGFTTIIFATLYYFVPNTKVKISAAMNSSFVVAGAFVLIQFLYVETQLMVSGANAVYGVFAAIPLFFAWLNISWTIILFGAELSHAFQNIDYYKLNNEQNG